MLLSREGEYILTRGIYINTGELYIRCERTNGLIEASACEQARVLGECLCVAQ